MKQLNQAKINQFVEQLKSLKKEYIFSTETFLKLFENNGSDFLFGLSDCLVLFEQYQTFLEDKINSKPELFNETNKNILSKQNKLKTLLDQIRDLTKDALDVESDIELIIKQNNAKYNAEFKHIEKQIKKEYREAGYILHTINTSKFNAVEKNCIQYFLNNNNIIFKAQGERIRFLQTPEFKDSLICYLVEKTGQKQSYFSFYYQLFITHYQLTDGHLNYPQYLLFRID